MSEPIYQPTPAPLSCGFLQRNGHPDYLLVTRASWSNPEAGVGVDLELRFANGWPTSLPSDIILGTPSGLAIGKPTVHAVVIDTPTNLLDHPMNLIATRTNEHGSETLGVAHCTPPSCRGTEDSDIGRITIAAASPGDKNVRLHIEGGFHNGRPTLTSEPFLIKIMVSRLEAALCTPCSLLRGASVTLLLHRAPLCAPLVHRLRAVLSLCSVTLPSLNGHCPSVPPVVQSISTPT